MSDSEPSLILDEPIEEIMANILPKVRVDLKNICTDAGIDVEEQQLEQNIEANMDGIDSLDTSYLNRIKALTDHIQQSQCQELQRFQKLLTEEIAITSPKAKTCLNKSSEETAPVCRESVSPSLPRKGSTRLDELYQHHFKREAKKRQRQTQKNLETIKKQNKSKLAPHSERLLRRREKSVLHSAYKAAVEMSGAFDKPAMKHVLFQLGVLNRRTQRIIHDLWDILAQGDDTVSYLTFQKYISLIIDPKSSRIVRKLSKQIDGFDQRFLDLAPILIQNYSTRRLMRPIAQKLSQGTQDLVQKELAETTFHPKINRKSEDYFDAGPRYEQLYASHNKMIRKKRLKKQELEKEKAMQSMKECTFKPNTYADSILGEGFSSGDIFDMLHTSALTSKILDGGEDIEKTEDVELKTHCTFQPNIKKKKTKYVQVNPLQIQGYEQHVKKSRKNTKDKELNRDILDKKIQSYSAQYDKRMRRRKKMLLQNSYADIHKKNLRKRKPITQDKDEPDVIYVNVAISPTESSRLTLKAEDDPVRIAREFARAWDLSDAKKHRLEHTIAIQIQKLKKRGVDTGSINEVNEEYDSLSTISSVSDGNI